jgi:glycine cleavage system H protein
MEVPDNLLYSKDHEWIELVNDKFRIGITEYAQGELGDIVFMELPEIGLKIVEGDTIGTIEAVKTVADVYAPISGEIIDINTDLESDPELINNDPYAKGWIVSIKADKEIDSSKYLNASQYKEFIGK